MSLTNTPIVQLRSIGKSFGPVKVLEDVSLDLYPGEVHVLAGENGAGKSTLIKVLSGVHPSFDGGIKLKGKDVAFSSPVEANRAGISVIHQELSMVDSLSVKDNLMLGREPTRFWGCWLDRKAVARHAQKACKDLDLDLSEREFASPVGAFPVSVKTRIEIAKALSFDADIIIMDEPTSALNRVEAERLFTLIGDLRERGCAIVYISHKMEEIYRVADRISVLRNGRLIVTETAEKLPEDDLITAMIGRTLEEFIPPARKEEKEGSPRLRISGMNVLHPEPLRPDLVKDFNLNLHVGEIVGLAGLQGSGCHQALQGIFGSSPGQVTGEILMDGRPFVPRNPRDSIKNGLAFLTPDRKRDGLVLGMNVCHNITLAALPGLSPYTVLSPAREHHHAIRRVEELGIHLDSLSQPVSSLSGGNQQKVVLGKWLETVPQILLLDEPTRGVDVGAKREIYKLIRQWASDGMSIILISTEMPELIGLSDRILVMHRGETTACLDAHEATPELILKAAMGIAA